MLQIQGCDRSYHTGSARPRQGVFHSRTSQSGWTSSSSTQTSSHSSPSSSHQGTSVVVGMAMVADSVPEGTAPVDMLEVGKTVDSQAETVLDRVSLDEEPLCVLVYDVSVALTEAVIVADAVSLATDSAMVDVAEVEIPTLSSWDCVELIGMLVAADDPVNTVVAEAVSESVGMTSDAVLVAVTS